MFIGGFEHSLDSKNRIILPHVFRTSIGNDFVITKGADRCLWILPKHEFEKLYERLKAQPMLSPDVLRLQRRFLAEGVISNVDQQGRVGPIPQKLKDYASIDREVMIVGQGERIEIWDKSRYEEITDIDDDSIRESARECGVG